MNELRETEKELRIRTHEELASFKAEHGLNAALGLATAKVLRHAQRLTDRSTSVISNVQEDIIISETAIWLERNRWHQGDEEETRIQLARLSF